MSLLSDAAGFGERVVSEFSEKNVPFMAAGLAYNAFVSLAPLLVVLFLVVSVVGGGLEDRVVTASGTWLPGPIADVVRQVFQGDATGGTASVVGLVVVLWGTLKVFRGLDTAFSEIYETTGESGFVNTLKDGVVVLVALVAAVVVTVGAAAVFAAFSETVPYVDALTPLVLVAGLVLAFYPMFYVFPDADLGWRSVLPGVLFAAVGWAAFQALFQVYLAFSDPSAGSFFGGVVIVVTYLYFSAFVLLLGAVVNAVVGNHSSGTPGGVGQGAVGYETDVDASMRGDSLAKYLQDLREDITGHYRGMRPRTDGLPRRERPGGDVEVIEQHSADADGETRRVTLTWQASGDESGSGEAADSGLADRGQL